MKNYSRIDPAILIKSIYTNALEYGILTFDMDGKVNSWNAGAERITGFLANEIMGLDNSIMFTPEDIARDEPRQEMRIAQIKGRSEDYRWHVRKDGSRFWADGALTPLMDHQNQQIGFLKIFRDITERKEAEYEMHRVANTDRLTGVPNRHAFEIYANDMISLAMRGGQPIALHLIDLDRFKQINDSLGHHAGDELLQQAAHRMQAALRESDFLARLGGDEFVILQPNLASVQAGAELASKIVQVLSEPFKIGPHVVEISGSVGISISPQDGPDLDQLLKKADLALYRTKKNRREKYHYFTEELDAQAHKKNVELSELRRAVEAKDFWLEYQPQIDALTGRTIALEALLRCSNPLLSKYPIDRIIELGMEAGLMKNLSLWIVSQACAQLREWKDNGIHDLKMCVNVCSHDLTDPEFPKFIAAMLADIGLRGNDLEIELTERQALDVELQGIKVLHELRSMDISLDIDDFGTGYSALSYLRDLPVTAVKLDKSFLVGVPYEVQGCSLVKAVMDLSHALQLEVVAEGVETAEQANFLRENHCDSLQGFYLSRPLKADAMRLWLMKGSATFN